MLAVATDAALTRPPIVPGFGFAGADCEGVSASASTTFVQIAGGVGDCDFDEAYFFVRCSTAASNTASRPAAKSSRCSSTTMSGTTPLPSTSVPFGE